MHRLFHILCVKIETGAHGEHKPLSRHVIISKCKNLDFVYPDDDPDGSKINGLRPIL